MDIQPIIENNSISLYQNKEEIAYFTIHENPYSVSINTGDFQGRGFAKLMIKLLCEKINFEPTTLIYVGADSSNGFWEAVGFKPNPYYDTQGREESGYELVIEFGKLMEWSKRSPSMLIGHEHQLVCDVYQKHHIVI